MVLLEGLRVDTGAISGRRVERSLPRHRWLLRSRSLHSTTPTDGSCGGEVLSPGHAGALDSQGLAHNGAAAGDDL